MRVLVLGAGIYGVTAALACRARGYDVRLFDEGPLPHPLAASTDISKAVRMDYGPDDEYLAWMERALDGWREWNERFATTLFHETGLLYLSKHALEPGGFEYESFARMRARGHAIERLDARAITERFPAWNAAHYPDGYFNPEGGYAASSATVTSLLTEARAQGVVLVEGARVRSLLERGGRVVGAQFDGGETHEADRVVCALGAWAPQVFPWLAADLRSVGMPVFHLRPEDPSRFLATVFPTFGADLSRTGWYGFPLHESGVVKVAHHGPGRAMHPAAPERVVTDDETARLRAFLEETFPSLARAPIVATRVCLYADSHDGHLWIDEDPGHRGLIVASGDSGHAFKFAPLLGDWIADAVDGRAVVEKFRWRPEARGVRNEEAARFQLDRAAR